MDFGAREFGVPGGRYTPAAVLFDMDLPEPFDVESPEPFADIRLDPLEDEEEIEIPPPPVLRTPAPIPVSKPALAQGQGSPELMEADEGVPQAPYPGMAVEQPGGALHEQGQPLANYYIGPMALGEEGRDVPINPPNAAFEWMIGMDIDRFQQQLRGHPMPLTLPPHGCNVIREGLPHSPRDQMMFAWGAATQAHPQLMAALLTEGVGLASAVTYTLRGCQAMDVSNHVLAPPLFPPPAGNGGGQWPFLQN